MFTVDKNRLGSGKIRDAVMGMFRSATNKWTPPFVRRKLLSVKKRSIRTYVTDVLWFVEDCYAGYILDHSHIDTMQEVTE